MLPLYFTPEDMEQLTGTAAVGEDHVTGAASVSSVIVYCCCCSHYFPFFAGECINQVRTIASLYANLHRLLRACPHVDLPIIAEGFSYHDFRWAVSTVMSRQNKIVLNHEAKVFSPALIPLWDFCNHCQGQVERHTDRQTDRQTDTLTFAFYTFTEVFFNFISY